MNKIKKLLFPAAAMLFFCGCTEEFISDTEVVGNTTIVARMAETPHTRTCIGNDGTSDVSIYWMPADNIGVYGETAKNVLFVNRNTVASAEGQFSGYLSSTAPLYAYYPYNKENAGVDYTSLRGNLPLVQNFDMSTGSLQGDYKVGVPQSSQSEDGAYVFDFEHLFSLLEFDINATGTALEGDRLERITLTLPDGRQAGGNFTFDASTKNVVWDAAPENANVIDMVWTDKPALMNGSQYKGYITCAPVIRSGDEIKVTILSEKYEATFTRTAKIDFAANACYTLPLTLANYTEITDGSGLTPRPGISSFKFEVANNTGKILGTRLVACELTNGVTTTTSPVTEESLTIGEDNTITGCIPYLYDFNLVPTFDVAEGVKVTVNGVEQKSGVTAQNFSKPVTYTVTSGTESRDYTVTVTNTGLPVVVVNQSASIAGGTWKTWAETGLQIRSKDSDWPEDDYISVYNADGTVSVDNKACGLRLRGNSSQSYPKKPFAIKMVKKAAMLDMPEHKRWVLLANWMDRTMLRNRVVFEMAHQLEKKNGGQLAWNPHGRNVELIYNGIHVGNYLLAEQIKIDGDRLNINDAYEDVIEDNSAAVPADCGYLLEFDDYYDENCRFLTSNLHLPCMLKDDVPWEDGSAFRSYVEDKVNGVDKALNPGLLEGDADYSAAAAILDIPSLIDWWFVHELAMNAEYRHPKSVYMYIDGKDGKLCAGPVWDFDYQTFPNPAGIKAVSSEMGGSYASLSYDEASLNEWLCSNYSFDNRWTGITTPAYDDKPYMWYPLLLQHEEFKAAVKAQWLVAYPKLQQVLASIRAFAEENRVSDSYNYAMWPLLDGRRTAELSPYVIDFSGDEKMTWDEAIDAMAKFYQNRLETMNALINSGNF